MQDSPRTTIKRFKSSQESWHGKLGIEGSGESDSSTDEYSDDDISSSVSAKKSTIPPVSCHGALLACGGGGSPENDPGLANRHHGEYRHKKYSGKLVRGGGPNQASDVSRACHIPRTAFVKDLMRQDMTIAAVAPFNKSETTTTPTTSTIKTITPHQQQHQLQPPEQSCWQTNHCRASELARTPASEGGKREQNNNEPASASRTAGAAEWDPTTCVTDRRDSSGVESRRTSTNSCYSTSSCSSSDAERQTPSPSLEDRWSTISVPPKKRLLPRVLEYHGQVLVTDVTCHRVTVTFWESATEKGFFKEYSQ